MGGLAGGRYIGPRGTTTGDATGGGGRSVMPNRDFLNALAERRRRQMLRNQMIGSGGSAPAIQGERRALTPPGGGYSGGVIPRFQGGSKIGGQGAAARARGRGRAPARRQQPWTWVPEEGLWGLPNTATPGYFYTLKQPGQGGAPAYTPGGGGRGGYSGGVVPRCQSGRTMNPRAGGESAMQRQRRMQWNNRTTPIPAGWGPYGSPFGPNARFPSPPGGWQAGGAVAPTNLGPLPGSPAAQPGYVSPYPSGGGPFESTYGIIPRRPSQRQMQMQAAHRGRGPGGWQAGGQFPEAAFPVENQLSDESPWYPDEEVGFEEAVPMQGGFDVFGRSGG